jgi:uncharacterized membrane protein HdeD (DUF308 family)
MAKQPLSGIIIGTFLIVVGIVLIFIAVFASNRELWFLLIYGIPSLIIGIALLFWKKEDDIEQRKDLVKPLKGGKK